MPFAVTEHVVKTPRHATAYLACGAADAPVIIFVHGWPELSISWRHQLPAFAALGFRCVAPDMRGYGRSSVYGQHADYALEHSVRDMIELVDALGRERAIWVGHDWGSPVVWDIASHHPERCHGVVNLCVPYLPKGFAPASLLPLVDRDLYPEDAFPAGQWEYQLFYEQNFQAACAAFEANPRNTVKVLFRKGDPAARGQPARLALVRKRGGWFGGRRGPGCADGYRRADGGPPCRLHGGIGTQRLLRSGFLVHEPRPQRRLCGNGGRRRPTRHAGAVPSRRSRPDLRHHGVASCRTDARILCGPDRSRDSVRALDGAGVSGRGERGIGEVAGRQIARRLDVVTGAVAKFNTSRRPARARRR